jgi:2-dehydropantoate 2-reductase
MRIAVFGAGGVGGYFGARLAESGQSVAFVARGDHLEAMRREGLRIESAAGDLHLRSVEASDDPRSIGPVDVVLVAVKAWQVGAAAAAMRPLLHDKTFVLPLQNGVEAADRLSEVLGGERVLAGLCRIVAYLAAPGLIRHTAVPPRIEFGERDGRKSERVDTLRQALERCRGVAATTPADIEAAIWEKLVFIAPVSGVGAVTRAPAGVMRALPETRGLIEAAMREVFDLARSRGVAVRDDIVTLTLRAIDSLPEDSTTSMQRDILEGRPSELEDQVGAVVRLGRAAKVAVPVHEFLYAALLPAERRSRGSPV